MDNHENQYIENYIKNVDNPLKILLGFFKGHIGDLVKTIFFILFKQSPVWVVSIVTANLINIVTNPSEHKITEIYINAAVAAVFIVQNVASTYAQAGYISRIVRNIELNLREALVLKLQHLSIGFHKRIKSGKLISKVMRDVEKTEEFLYSAFGSLITIIFDLIVAVAVILLNSPEVLLFFLCLVPATVFAIIAFRQKIGKNNTEYRKEVEKTQAAMTEMVELIPVTRAHGLQNMEIDRMGSKFKRIEKSGFRLDMINVLFGATSWVIFQLFNMVCLTFTSVLCYRGRITPGEVVLYQTYFNQLVGQIANLINMFPNITKGLESIRSIGEILSAGDLEKNNAIIPLGELKGRVTFEKVDFCYSDSDKPVLSGFDLETAPGQSVALVGSSGAGKSTVLNLLIGFDEPTGGRLLIDGINIANIDMDEYRAQIAVVPQNTILFSGTVRDNITYGNPNVSDEEIWAVLKEVGIDDVIAGMDGGINAMLGEHGGNLSGGQKQRLSIARALIRKPKIIIFDEATSALDSESEKKVQLATQRMMKSCTTFLVAHRLSTIKNADIICVVDGGKIVEKGSYDELMAKKDKFYRLKKMQE